MPKPKKAKSMPLKDMTFKVDPEFHYQYKTTSAILGLSMKAYMDYTHELARSQGFPSLKQKNH